MSVALAAVLSHNDAKKMYDRVVPVTFMSQSGVSQILNPNHSFIPLHTYFLTTSANGGSDSNNGLQPTQGSGVNGPWASPNHIIQCGDVVVVQNVSGYPAFNSWGQPTSCPSTSGGIDGTGGIYFASLVCAGGPGSCNITGSFARAISVNASNWAVFGFFGSEGYSCTANCNTAGPTGQTGLGFVADTSSANLHHILFANNISSFNGCGFTTFSGGGSNGVDYFSWLGNIAQNSSGRNDGFWCEAFHMISVFNFDTVAGTHILVDGNFGINNQQTVGGNSDGSCRTYDTLDFLNYSQQIVDRNNICFLSERFGLLPFYQGLNNNTPTLKIYNNTFFDNGVQANTSSEFVAPELVIQAGNGATTLPWIIQAYNNIGRTIGTSTNTAGAFLYGLNVGGSYAGPVIGNTGINPANSQNVFFAPSQTHCAGGFCDTTNSATTFGSSASFFGVNTYTDPLFTNTTDLLANQTGVPDCHLFQTVTACMGWSYATQTLTSPSVISDLVATASGMTGKGYQMPVTCELSDADYPSYLKGMNVLVASGWTSTPTFTEVFGLTNRPCAM